MQLKEKLIAKIDQINDEELLNQILRMIDFEAKPGKIYHLNPYEFDAVNKGIEQLNQGEFITNDEADRQAITCLKK